MCKQAAYRARKKDAACTPATNTSGYGPEAKSTTRRGGIEPPASRRGGLLVGRCALGVAVRRSQLWRAALQPVELARHFEQEP